MSSYKIVYSDNTGGYDYEFEKKINKMLEEGWSCIGGVVISFKANGHVYRMYQTMVKLPV
jgi:hypothetical protein